MAFTVVTDNYDVEKTLRSGQMFRYEKLDDGSFEVLSRDKVCNIQQRDAHLIEVIPLFEKSGDDEYWRNYFDFERDYSTLLEKMSQNKLLSKVADYNRGLHLLKQDAWECLISFVCSQQKRIPQIMECVRRLCEVSGRPLGYGRFAFPTADELCRFNIRNARLGYREPYVRSCAEYVRGGYINLDALYPEKCSYQQAMTELLRLPGVGVKVANCVALFGLHHSNAFPVDVHINRIMELPEMSGIDLDSFGDDLGILQQYLFNYAIHHGI